MIGFINLISFKKTHAAIAADKLNINLMPISAIEQNDQIAGSEYHPIGFMI